MRRKLLWIVALAVLAALPAGVGAWRAWRFMHVRDYN